MTVGNLTHNAYRYMADLLALEATATGQGPGNFYPATPLVYAVWKGALLAHPDQSFANYILKGIKTGFHIGADRSQLSLKQGPGNMPSTRQHPLLVEAHITEEVRANRILGPLPAHLAALCHTSPIGLIPKPHQPGRWRLIVDLSSPHGNSINDSIPVTYCHMHYASVLDAAELIRVSGPGTLMAKVDLHHAYRNLPVHADDHPLLAIKWGPNTYIDTALPFGLRSAPKIFSAFADALAWILQTHGITQQLHYLDDFLLLGPPQSTACADALQIMLQVCNDLGVPLATHKTEGPSTQLTFLGIQIDSKKMQLSLDREKLTRITALILSWRSRRSATKHELQSLIGHLSHAATVVQHGCTFIRRMIELMKIAKLPHHQLRLNTEFRSDLQWWATFLSKWNGISILRDPEPTHTITADASGSWGCGAFSSEGTWFMLEWPASWSQCHIAAKELIPVVIAIAMWGSRWSSYSVLVRSDNTAVVAAITSGAARDPLLMHLLRCLHFFLAHFDIRLQARHIAGKGNIAADALSRNNLVSFFQYTPQAKQAADEVPVSLKDMLLLQRPDWLSPSWRRMFLATLHNL